MPPSFFSFPGLISPKFVVTKSNIQSTGTIKIEQLILNDLLFEHLLSNK